MFFFFKQKTAYEMRISDWSSDVCSSDLMTGSLHASSYAPPGIARRVEQGRGRVAAMKSLRCAGAEYLRLAAGETHFSLFTRLMPWDHVPGTLLHSEAGGIAQIGRAHV